MYHSDVAADLCWHSVQSCLDVLGRVLLWLAVKQSSRMMCAAQTPRIPMPPPYQEGWTLEDSRTPVTQELYDTVSSMLKQMNTAIDLLPVAS